MSMMRVWKKTAQMQRTIEKGAKNEQEEEEEEEEKKGGDTS
jgi:hypothetical protein